MVAEYCESEDLNFGDVSDVSADDIRRMEWQANSFASILVLPRVPFLDDFAALARVYDLKDHGHGLLFVDEQQVNQRTYYAVTDWLKGKYGVSRSVVRYRLQGFGLLTDARSQMARM